MSQLINQIETLMKNNSFYKKHFIKIIQLDVNKNISYSIIKELFNKLTTYKDIFRQENFNLFDYKSIEKLDDDLVKLIQKHQKRSFAHSFLSKKYHKILSDTVYDVFGELKSLGISRDTINNNLINKVAAYKKAEEFSDACLVFLDNITNNNIVDIKQKALKYNTQVVYENHEKKLLILRVLDYTASRNLGSSSWCISYNSNYWHNYVGNQTGFNLINGKRQLFIYDFNLPSNHRYSLIGVTMDRHGKIEYAYDMRDVSSKKYIENSDLKSIITDCELFNPEDTINFVKNSKISKTKKYQFILNGLPNNFMSFVRDMEEIEGKDFLKSRVNVCCFDFINNIKNIDINKFIKSNINSEEDLNVFYKIFKDNTFPLYFLIMCSDFNFHNLNFSNFILKFIENNDDFKEIIETNNYSRYKTILFPNQFSYQQKIQYSKNINRLINEKSLSPNFFSIFDKDSKFASFDKDIIDITKNYINNPTFIYSIKHTIDNYFYFLKIAYEQNDDFWLNSLLTDLKKNNKTYDPLSKTGFRNKLVDVNDIDFYKFYLKYFKKSDFSFILMLTYNRDFDDFIDLLKYFQDNNVFIGELDYIQMILNTQNSDQLEKVLDIVNSYQQNILIEKCNQVRAFIKIFSNNLALFEGFYFTLDVNYKSVVSEIEKLNENAFNALIKNNFNFKAETFHLFNNKKYAEKILKFVGDVELHDLFDDYILSHNENEVLKNFFENMSESSIHYLLKASKHPNLRNLIKKFNI